MLNQRYFLKDRGVSVLPQVKSINHFLSITAHWGLTIVFYVYLDDLLITTKKMSSKLPERFDYL